MNTEDSERRYAQIEGERDYYKRLTNRRAIHIEDQNERIAELEEREQRYKRETEMLGESIKKMTVSAGILRKDAPLTGPMLLMLCEDMGDCLKQTEEREAALAADIIDTCERLKYSDSGQSRYNAALTDIQAYAREVVPKQNALARHDADLIGDLAMKWDKEGDALLCADCKEQQTLGRKRKYAACVAANESTRLRQQAEGGA